MYEHYDRETLFILYIYVAVQCHCKTSTWERPSRALPHRTSRWCPETPSSTRSWRCTSAVTSPHPSTSSPHTGGTQHNWGLGGDASRVHMVVVIVSQNPSVALSDVALPETLYWTYWQNFVILFLRRPEHDLAHIDVKLKTVQWLISSFYWA